jgi:hypothetical protein
MPTPIQAALNAAFGDLRIHSSLGESLVPPKKMTPEEIQNAFNDMDGLFQWKEANTPKGRQRKLRFTAGPTGQKKRCDARTRKPSWVNPKTGKRHYVGPRCRAWALENGRCRWHGGLSTGARTPEGKKQWKEAVHAKRPAWIAKRKAAGEKIPWGRKSGAKWVTEAMVEAARAEARRLGANRFDLTDRALVVALLRSAGRPLIGNYRVIPSPAELTARARALLDAHEARFAEADRQAAKAAIAKTRELVNNLSPRERLPLEKLPHPYRDFIYRG